MRRAKSVLTEVAIRGLTPGRELADRDMPGLSIRARRSSKGVSRTFTFRYGSKRFTIGAWPAVTLAAARRRARKLAGEVAAGGDPQARKIARRRAESFEELAMLYLERHSRPKKRSWREDQRKIERDLLPAWRGRKASEIGRRDVIELVEGVAHGRGPGRRRPGAKAPVSANRLLALISAIFSFAVEREIVSANPAARVRKPGREQPRNRVLDEHEIRTLWRALDDEPPATAAAWRLILLTAQRPGEVLGMTFDEIRFDHDLGAHVWSLAPSRMKGGVAHRVPVSGAAVEIVEGVRPLDDGAGFVLASYQRGKHLSDLKSSNRRILAATGLARFTPHDLRRSSATIMQGLRVPPHVIDRILAHQPRGVGFVYMQSEYLDEQARAVEKLAERVEQIVSGRRAKVVRLRPA